MKRSAGRGLLRICGIVSVLFHDIAALYLISMGIYLFQHIRLNFPEQIGQYLVGYTRRLIRVLHLEMFQIEVSEAMSWIVLAALLIVLIAGIAAGVWAIVGKATLISIFDSIILLYLDVVWLAVMVFQGMTGGEKDVVSRMLHMPYLAGAILAAFCLLYLIAVVRRFFLLGSYWKKCEEEAALASTMNRSESTQSSTGSSRTQRDSSATRGSWLKENNEEDEQAPVEEKEIRRKKRWTRRLVLCSVFAVAASGAAAYMGVIAWQKSEQHREMVANRAAQALEIVPTLDVSEPSRLSRLGIVGYWYCVEVENGEERKDIDDETGNLILGLMEDHQAYLQMIRGDIWKRDRFLTFMTGTWLYQGRSALALDISGFSIACDLIDGRLALHDGESTYYMEKEPDFSPSIVQQNMANAQMAVGTWVTDNRNSDIQKITFSDDGTWKAGKESGTYITEYGDQITAIGTYDNYYFDIANDKLDYYFTCGEDVYHREEDRTEEMTSEAEEEMTENAAETEPETSAQAEGEMSGGVE